MNIKFVQTILIGAGALALVAAAARGAGPMIQTDRGIESVNGGVGMEERAMIHPAFPLKLVFADNKEYLTDVRVIIRDTAGRTVFETMAKNGPWLFVNLPTGHYKVQAIFKDVTRIAHVSIPTSSVRKNVTFEWPSSLEERQLERAGGSRLATR